MSAHQSQPPYPPPPVVVRPVTANTIGLGILLGAIYVAATTMIIGTVIGLLVLLLDRL